MYVQVNAAGTTDAMEGGQLYITGSTTPLCFTWWFHVIDIGEKMAEQ